MTAAGPLYAYRHPASIIIPLPTIIATWRSRHRSTRLSLVISVAAVAHADGQVRLERDDLSLSHGTTIRPQ